jgi:SAM-dependent methyltransferase
VLDIGCNDGTLLRAFRSRGQSRVFGYEPNRELAVKAAGEGIEVANGFFSAGASLPEKAKLVTANNMFANVDDLDDFMAGIAKVLHPAGSFVLETGYAVDLVQNAVIDNVHHEHLSYFTLSSLQALFSRHGMQIWNAERVPTKGGSIRCYVQWNGGPHREAAFFRELRVLETELGFDTLLPFRALERRLADMKRRLGEWTAKLPKGVGAGFGASVGTVTMLEYFGLNDLVSVLYDDNPIKVGTFSPLRDIPVKSSSTLLDDMPGTVVNLAWRYRSRISARHAEYLRRGGKFLSILPELQLSTEEGSR